MINLNLKMKTFLATSKSTLDLRSSLASTPNGMDHSTAAKAREFASNARGTLSETANRDQPSAPCALVHISGSGLPLDTPLKPGYDPANVGISKPFGCIAQSS